MESGVCMCGPLTSRNPFRQVEIGRCLFWLVIAIGVLLRLRQYLFNRSMWLNESFLALDVMHNSLRGLVTPLGYGQLPPIGFVLSEKLVQKGLGNSEYAFRLIPLLAGVGSLFVFSYVAKQVVRPRAVLIALGLFAISYPLVYYSSEAGQYSLDVLVSLALYALALPMEHLEWTSQRIFLLGIFGAAAIWYSYASIFTLGGIGLTLAIKCILHRRWSRFWSLVFPFLLWVCSIGLCYWIIVRPAVEDAALFNPWRSLWSSSFLPFPPLSMRQFNWYINTLFNVFEFPGGISATGLAVALFGIGLVSLLARRKFQLSFLMIPILLTLMVSANNKYPFGGQLILFMAPALILPVAEGVEHIRTECMSSVIPIFVVVVLFLLPVASACRYLIKPETREETRPVINYIRAKEKPGDILYLSRHSFYAYRYYAQRHDMGSITVMEGLAKAIDSNQCAEGLAQLRGHHRLWVLFSHVDLETQIRDLDALDCLGRKIDSFHADGASAYLFTLQDTRLRPPQPSTGPGTASLPNELLQKQLTQYKGHGHTYHP